MNFMGEKERQEIQSCRVFAILGSPFRRPLNGDFERLHFDRLSVRFGSIKP